MSNIDKSTEVPMINNSQTLFAIFFSLLLSFVSLNWNHLYCHSCWSFHTVKVREDCVVESWGGRETTLSPQNKRRRILSRTVSTDTP